MQADRGSFSQRSSVNNPPITEEPPADHRQTLGTDPFLKKSSNSRFFYAILESPRVLQEPAAYPGISSSPSFCADRTRLWPESEKWSFCAYCVFTHSRLRSAHSNGLLCKMLLPLLRIKTSFWCGSRVTADK